MTYKTEGIIIKRMNFKEADLLLTVLTPNKGKLAVIAKGARKIKSKMSGALELFYVVDLMLAEGKNFETLCSAVAKERHLFLRADLGKLGQAYHLAEIADRFMHEGDPSPHLYQECLKSLRLLENHDSLAVRAFEVKVFGILGFGPELETCVSCHGELEAGKCGLSRNYGGVVCHECTRKDPEAFGVDDNVVKVLRVMARYDAEVVSKISGFRDFMGPIERFSEGYLERILQKPLRSKRFISKIASGDF